MNKLIFLISTIFIAVIDASFAIFFAISLFNVFTKFALLGNIHFILFIVTLSINVVYLAYLITTLIYNKVKS